ncbi:MAG: TIGR04283 family arsenosugar biosynthesis glycosyltransferase [Acidobacteriota bacterium]
MNKAGISIIIPALNEAAHLPRTLASCRDPDVREVIVVDGGSSDDTVRIAAREGAVVLETPPGRGGQQRAGADAARGSVLLFLHADTVLPGGFGPCVEQVLSRPGTAAGAFRLSIAATGRAYRILEKGVEWRTRYLQLPYGDQGIFLARETYEAAGGIPELPFLEDLALVLALRKVGRIRLAPEAVVTSARRWERHGPWRMVLWNQLAVAAYLIGIPPEKIHRWYQRRAG